MFDYFLRIFSHVRDTTQFFWTLFYFILEDDQTITQFALELQDGSPDTGKLKKRSVLIWRMLSSVECSYFFQMCQNYTAFTTWNSGMIFFFLAKSKCSENEKAFQAKYYWLEKMERILQNLCFFILEIKFPLKLCTSSGLFLALD